MCRCAAPLIKQRFWQILSVTPLSLSVHYKYHYEKHTHFMIFHTSVKWPLHIAALLYAENRQEQKNLQTVCFSSEQSSNCWISCKKQFWDRNKKTSQLKNLSHFERKNATKNQSTHGRSVDLPADICRISTGGTMNFLRRIRSSSL